MTVSMRSARAKCGSRLSRAEGSGTTSGNFELEWAVSAVEMLAPQAVCIPGADTTAAGPRVRDSKSGQER